MDKTGKYNISDFDLVELCGLDPQESCRRAFFLQEKLSDVLTSIESHIEVTAMSSFGEQKPKAEVYINDDNGIECSVRVTPTDLLIAQFVGFAEALGLAYEDVSVDYDEDGTLIYWTHRKEDVLNNI